MYIYIYWKAWYTEKMRNHLRDRWRSRSYETSCLRGEPRVRAHFDSSRETRVSRRDNAAMERLSGTFHYLLRKGIFIHPSRSPIFAVLLATVGASPFEIHSAMGPILPHHPNLVGRRSTPREFVAGSKLDVGERMQSHPNVTKYRMHYAWALVLVPSVCRHSCAGHWRVI